ncbi:hypothetical protein QQX98_008955 [Neonectria punicea]|uniref:SnoaL-like domain-containing protein n=1 Tax=Neonectria punicea TaxID=979145 RepID=A0ABR1GU83_9HYPO
MFFNPFLILAVLGLANTALAAESSNIETEAACSISGSSLESHSLARNPLDYELIRNALTHYSYSLDEKSWDGLSNVYTEDVKLLRSMIEPLITQHSLTTQSIDMTGDETATVKPYGRAIHFGTGDLRDQSVTVWGKYEDKVEKLTVNGVTDWRIVERRIFFQGQLVGNGSLIGFEG